MERRKECPGRLLVDGHFTLRNRATGVIEPVFTPGDKGFYDALVLVEAPAEQVHTWRTADSRKRVVQSVEEMKEHQARERKHAEVCAKEMDVPLVIIDVVELESRVCVLSEFLDTFCPL
jgi:adenylate kinase